MTIPAFDFTKWEGLGNDFIVIDRREGGDWPTPEHVVQLCDRHFGIGADGLLIITPHPVAGAGMVVINADGSRPEMCGNGLRCVAGALAEDGSLSTHIATDAGLLPVQATAAGFRIQMGAAILAPAQTVTVDEAIFTGQPVSTGNPHFVLYRDVPWSAAEIDRWGERLSRHADFDAGANISFAHARDAQTVELVVWERGAGKTLACGTGACATAAAGWADGRVQGEVEVHLPGGALRIGGSIDEVWMEGPARRVFSGRWVG
jgi:diaminopimelate epimerase